MTALADDTAAGSRSSGRFVLPGLGLAVFLAMTLLYRRDYGLYRAILETGGIKVENWPFVDTSLLLASWECMRQGVDVWVTNPCDIMQRVYSYSPLWGAFAGLPLDKTDAAWLGWCEGLVFIASLALLPPVRGFWGWAAIVAAVLSPAAILGVERGNLDEIAFAMAMTAAALAESGLAARLFGYALVLAAALMKYYPAVILVVALRERLRVFAAIAAATLLVVALFWAGYHATIVESLVHIPGAPYTHGYFGAKNLPFEFGELAAGGRPMIARALGLAFFLVLFLVCLRRGWKLLRQEGLPEALSGVPTRERVFLAVGAAAFVGCFFAGQNVVYREVFFLPAIPGLILLARHGVRSIAVATLGLILFQLWGNAVPAGLLHAAGLLGAPEAAVNELGLLLWIARELAGWWSATVLLAVLADFVARSTVVREVFPRLRPAG